MPESYGLQLHGHLIALLNAAMYFAVIAMIFVPLERLFAAHPQKILRKGVVVDFCYYFLSSLLPVVLLSVPLGVLAWLVRSAVPGSLHEAFASLPFWARVIVAAVAGEVGYYWGHRLSHEIPFLWDFHAIHHSAEEIDFLVSTRSHPIDFVFSRLCEVLPLYVLGLAGPEGGLAGIQIPIVVRLIGMIWGFFIHANLRWRFGPLEWLITTPAFHHWHHTRTGPINHNYSSTFPWIDRVFGTHHLPRHGLPESYGIKAKLPDSLVGQLLYPLVPPLEPPGPTMVLAPIVETTSEVRLDNSPPVSEKDDVLPS